MLSTGNSNLDELIKNEIASKGSLDSVHQVIAEWNYNAYTEMDSIGCFTTNAVDSTSFDDGTQTETYTSDDNTKLYEPDIKRIKYTPLKDIFGINRPNPGIIHSVYTSPAKNTKQPLNGDADPLTISKVFNMRTEDTRLYPMSRNSPYRYWNSARKVNKVLVGVSASDKTITHAAPFVKYKTEISTNKIVVKTQKHLGYPLAYRVDILVGTTWSTAYEATGTARSISSVTATPVKPSDPTRNIYYKFTMSSGHGIKYLDDVLLSRNGEFYTVSKVEGNDVTFYSQTPITGIVSGDTLTVSNMYDGKLDAYYDPANGGSWGRYTPYLYNADEKTVTDFSTTNTQTKKIKGVRFVVTKMSNPNIPLEVIELSPRLVADITNSVVGFDVNSSIGQSQYGLPVGTIISSNGSLKLSNTERFFNKNNPNSILKDILRPNVQIKLFQKMNVTGIDYRFPLKVMYTGMWNESPDFQVDTQLEDYFKFFKEMSAPDLMVANETGVPTSVAILMLLDNIGFNAYKFQKTNTEADQEDVVLDYFYSKKEQSVMEVLEAIAVSTQTSIYIDYDSYADNEVIAMTKERMLAAKENKDFWLSGNDGSFTKDVDFFGGAVNEVTFISNVASFQENIEPPVTDINIKYAGIGIEKMGFSLQDMDEDKRKEVLEGPTGAASVANRDLRYTPDIVWKPTTNKENSENYLAAASLVSDMSATRPKDAFANITKDATSKYEAIRKFYDQNQSVMSMFLDRELINTFINSYQGYIMVDTELVRYEGIRFLIFDPVSKKSSRKILFSKEEYAFERSRVGQGGSIEPDSLVVYIETRQQDLTGTQKRFTVISDGRGQKNTKIVYHKGTNTAQSFFTRNPQWSKFGGQLYDKKIATDIIAAVKADNIVDTQISNDSVGESGSIKVPVGYLKVTAPPSSLSGREKSGIKEATSVRLGVPMNSSSEQIITGIVRDVGAPVRKIGTRMRLVSSVPKNVEAGEKLIKEGIIAGIGWNITATTNDFSGYIVEVEEVGTIDAASILDAKYRNLRFYRVNPNNSITFFGNAWVNVSGTPNEKIDFNAALSDARQNGKAYAQIFDLEVTMRRQGGKVYYEVIWENQVVVEAEENVSSILPERQNVALITRGPSAAIYEYVYAFSSPDDIVVPDSASYVTKNLNTSASQLVSRGLMPDIVKVNTDSDKAYELKGIFEDFGKMAREVKKFDVRYQYPSLNPKLISLADYNPNYYVSDFTTSSFGSSFWLYNTASGPIQIDESTFTPLWVSAYALKEIMGGTLQSSKYIETSQEDKILNDSFDINRQTYGKQEISLSGEYINNLDQARKLADWVVSNVSKERKTISIGIFPIPLLELGDKVGLLYSDKLYNDSNKCYTVTSISHSISQSGPQMTLEVKECV
jgi:hypothetical protein